MSVYVDNPIYRLGRMHMCHMLADSTEELLLMASRLGLGPHWIQKAGQPDEHFDVCKTKRAAAIKYGAIAVSGRDLVKLIRERRNRIRNGGPERG